VDSELLTHEKAVAVFSEAQRAYTGLLMMSTELQVAGIDEDRVNQLTDLGLDLVDALGDLCTSLSPTKAMDTVIAENKESAAKQMEEIMAALTAAGLIEVEEGEEGEEAAEAEPEEAVDGVA
jgi:hypothetical protein